jgi:hypothetical protein
MPKLNIPTPALIAALTAFLGGGLAGAIFSYYVNRPQPSVLMYTVTTTTIVTAEPVGFIPNLRVAVGQESVKSLYVHTIDVSSASGPFVQQANIALALPNKPHIYGTDMSSPSPVHSIACTTTEDVIKCQLSPISIDVPKPYRISVATDSSVPPTPVMAANNVRLLSATEVATSSHGIFAAVKNPEIYALGVGTLAYFSLSLYAIRKLRRFMPGRLIVLGKIAGPDGVPVSGAQVEVETDSPYRTMRKATTDATGDFIMGGLGLKKEPTFSARVKVTHPGFRTAEFETSSAIISYALSERRRGSE